jgi:N-acetylglucosaminyldiphosphoundecaprenol N-acetyl-beta-D-mannosaminyltransferase
LIETAKAERDVWSALHRATLVLPDGAPVAWLARALGATSVPRIAGSDVFEELSSRSTKGRHRHFFVGATPETLSLLTARLEQRYPGVEVVGSYAPPFAPRLDRYVGEVAAKLEVSGANIVWVGLGAPKQEIFMEGLSAAYPAALLLGVGAVFDFASGQKSRAPQWMQKHGLEWIHRLGTEPRRLLRRYLVTNSKFIWHTLLLLGSRRLSARGRESERDA